MLKVLIVLAALCLASGFVNSGIRARNVLKPARASGVRSLTAVLDILAGAALATQLNTAPINYQPSVNSFTIAKTEVVQGMYKEYTVEKNDDDSALDEIRRNYKTAEETEESKDKYWAILAVLLAGSFAIPMVQYYWYVADEDD